MTVNPHKCGHVTIIGRPNVGKSTLLNQVLQQKISITSKKPQTTRFQLTGIKTDKNYQVVYVDTPGIQEKPVNALNRYMNKTALSTINNVDLLVYMIAGKTWDKYDHDFILELDKKKLVKILVINKIDRIKNKSELLPFIENLEAQYSFSEIVPISAYSEKNIRLFEQTVLKYLPVAPAIYPEDQITDKSERFIAAEYIREKLMRRLGDELPYQLSVSIEKHETRKELVIINAVIWVSSSGQKAIVIGKNGNVLKKVGEKARKDIENLYEKKVLLKTWVKVREKWMDDSASLEEFGYFNK